MMQKKQERPHSRALYEAILKLQDVEECEAFFEDLCAVTELRAMEQRFEVAKLLREGKVYTDILERTGTSSATISRVNRMLSGGNGMLETVLDRE